MAQVAVVTDSVACLPDSIIKKYGIIVVPVALAFDGQEGAPCVDPASFYQRLESSKRLPTTSPASPGVYLDAFKRMARESDAIVCVTISSKVSATYEAARNARDMAKESLPGVSIEVVDSQAAAMAQGFVTLAAARAAAEGGDLQTVAAAANGIASRVYLLGVIDTFRYLVKSGRVPKVAGWAASMLQIKPILQIHRGEIGLAARARTKSRALRRMLELMKEHANSKPIHVSVVHANAPTEAEELRRQVNAEFQCAELYVSEFPPVMGVHTGPGLVGLAFYSEL